jgi:hypothetical protein
MAYQVKLEYVFVSRSNYLFYPSSCNLNPDYSQFKCLEQYCRRTLENNHTCLLVHQVQGFAEQKKPRPCQNRTDFLGILHAFRITRAVHSILNTT